MRHSLPLRTPRLFLLGLTWALGIIGAAAGLNAIVKRNDQVSSIKQAVAALRITVFVDTNNILRSGIVLAVGCLLLALVASVFIGLLVLDSLKPSSANPISTRTLGVQTGLLGFLTVWIFACLVAVTKFAATGSASVAAYTGSIRVPDALVHATESQLGFSRVYWDQLYVRILTVAPWVTFLFALITTIVSFSASRRRSATSEQSGWNDREKGEAEMRENARAE
ncbi:hypothetical protein RhiXN_00434 [Rhizoctonia solani]|uniref:Transmembrane protein n=1 Tax=Rhizoctonia solani TaxID=456999 RepID=A0A8H7INP9_9AGAM|nr:uncharacterized protein RhiXN_00434 [Rhizoctonia solani]KAF8679989.1 hypothetical protein RHS04_04557 [Rhizoctonia solani]KAF8760903.1 hypothetical protein RHS01_00947 [Rhizoctonia solani]QRW19028.1 hypothetical protein RhiXN_00434 [Rhizoctonia solani]